MTSILPRRNHRPAAKYPPSIPPHNAGDRRVTHGYTEHTLATHLRRRADADAEFLVPYIKPTDYILDVSCSPGTITTGFLKYAPEGAVVGIDISSDVLDKARQGQVATDNSIPLHQPTDALLTGKSGDHTVSFLQAEVLAGLPFLDNTFDVVYCSQVLGHLPPPDLPRQAIAKIRRILKPGGVLGSREGCDTHFYPRHLSVNDLWVPYQRKELLQNAPPGSDNSGSVTPALFRAAGFDADNDKVLVGGAARVFSGREQRARLGWRAKGQLVPGDQFYQNWINAGILAEEIGQLRNGSRPRMRGCCPQKPRTLGWK
ncbi:ubie coq5 methyltransferase [Ophiostoma piceae UAMH 11346]|uniref:Ubie coq5 methyltransferase n=1 Tax=Ophiostoma piceae (strain UAMH 11346) TaxID=1262450 RepID=S3BSI6_OPHP1|nr:ubie coq5 methyltransferase [Ophiostoma piceae UAMH 11346]